MTRKSNPKGKSKGIKARENDIAQKSQIPVDIPIPNLPEKFLWMHVNSGTKIRNVLSYALKEFPLYKSVVWSGAGHGIAKVITCAEVCKRKNPGLHQITKLRYIRSKKSEMGKESEDNRAVPEIHIMLAKDPLDPSEPGHQSSTDKGLFLSRVSNSASSNDKSTDKISENLPSTKKDGQESSSSSSTNKLSNVATEEFAAMGLRTGQKRSHNNRSHQTSGESSPGNKSRKKGKNTI